MQERGGDAGEPEQAERALVLAQPGGDVHCETAGGDDEARRDDHLGQASLCAPWHARYWSPAEKLIVSATFRGQRRRNVERAEDRTLRCLLLPDHSRRRQFGHRRTAHTPVHSRSHFGWRSEAIAADRLPPNTTPVGALIRSLAGSVAWKRVVSNPPTYQSRKGQGRDAHPGHPRDVEPYGRIRCTRDGQALPPGWLHASLDDISENG